MTTETDNIENEMGNSVSGSKDILHSIVPGPEGDQKEKTEEVHTDDNILSTDRESESVPEQSTGSDQQQPTVDRKDDKPKDTDTTSSELQHDGPTESGSSSNTKSEQPGTHNRRNKQQCNSLFWNFIQRQQEAWDKYAKSDNNRCEDKDVIMDENTRSGFPARSDDYIPILDMFVINPNALKFKNRRNKKKNKKKWHKKWNKHNGNKIQYIIL